MSEFFNMGGYGGYVWPTYAVAAVVLIAVLLSTLRGLKRSEKTLEGLQQARRSVRRQDKDRQLQGKTGPTLDATQTASEPENASEEKAR